VGGDWRCRRRLVTCTRGVAAGAAATAGLLLALGLWMAAGLSAPAGTSVVVTVALTGVVNTRTLSWPAGPPATRPGIHCHNTIADAVNTTAMLTPVRMNPPSPKAAEYR
jgi:hypothetical protein